MLAGADLLAFSRRLLCQGRCQLVAGDLDETMSRPVEAAEAQACRIAGQQSADDATLDPRRAMRDAPGFGERRRHVDHENAPGDRSLHRVYAPGTIAAPAAPVI